MNFWAGRKKNSWRHNSHHTGSNHPRSVPLFVLLPPPPLPFFVYPAGPALDVALVTVAQWWAEARNEQGRKEVCSCGVRRGVWGGKNVPGAHPGR